MRIFLFVINGLGVGSLPDYSKLLNSLNKYAISLSLSQILSASVQSELDEKHTTSTLCFFKVSIKFSAMLLSSSKTTLPKISLKPHSKFVFVVSILPLKKCPNLFVNDFLASVIGELKYDDVLIASGNFGVNPSKIGITREYNPIFVCSKLLGTSQSLKTIQGNNCIAMSVVELLKIYPNSNSFVGSKLRQKIDNYGILLKNEIIASRLINTSSYFNSPITDAKKSLTNKIASSILSLLPLKANFAKSLNSAIKTLSFSLLNSLNKYAISLSLSQILCVKKLTIMGYC